MFIRGMIFLLLSAIGGSMAHASATCMYANKKYDEGARLCQVRTELKCTDRGNWEPTNANQCLPSVPISHIQVTRAIWLAFDNESHACAALERVQQACDGYEVCSIASARGVCSGSPDDPAVGHRKKLLIRYQCIKENQTSIAKEVMAVEGSNAELSCR